MTPISHLLIGIPGAGKTTLATAWAAREPNCCIVSTDLIRQQLFGGDDRQGDWALIEAEVIAQVKAAIAAHQTILYDATNVKRSWRIGILQTFAALGATQWIGWHCNTPLAECLQRNQQRQRQVDPAIIEHFAQQLKDFPPVPAEGLLAVHAVPMQHGQIDFAAIHEHLRKLPKTIAGRNNRCANDDRHAYSRLVDFERLMHLIALLLQFPGLGSFHIDEPDTLLKLLGSHADIADSLTEVCAVMARRHHKVYADRAAIAADLDWLEASGMIGEQHLDQTIMIPAFTETALLPYACHAYSDRDRFQRLLTTIRLLAHYPYFAPDTQRTTQDYCFEYLKDHTYTSCETFRKDIQRVLNPYQLLPAMHKRRGYFLGTAILTKTELLEAFQVMQTQVERLNDPIATQTYQTIARKLQLSRLSDVGDRSAYPVRAIGSEVTIDVKTLPERAVYREIDILTDAIRAGRQLQLNRIAGTGRPDGDPHQNQPFRIYPLQIMFHKIGWYLGYECVSGAATGLLRFERLDRLVVEHTLTQQRGLEPQRTALKQLETLYRASASPFLGNHVPEQANYLAGGSDRQSVEIVLELWCTDPIFRYISEGTNRFQPSQMKMSQRLDGSHYNRNLDPQMFSLKRTQDSQFPNRFQVKLPCWTLEDWDLQRWILGFTDSVKIVHPPEMITKIQATAASILSVYETT